MAFNSQGKLPAASPGNQCQQCHQFGAFTALAAEDLEADGMLLDVHS